MKKLPLPEVVEFDEREAWQALVDHFGVEVINTVPMGLDELPAPLALQPTERDTWQRLIDIWSNTNAK